MKQDPLIKSLLPFFLIVPCSFLTKPAITNASYLSSDVRWPAIRIPSESQDIVVITLSVDGWVHSFIAGLEAICFRCVDSGFDSWSQKLIHVSPLVISREWNSDLFLQCWARTSEAESLRIWRSSAKSYLPPNLHRPSETEDLQGNGVIRKSTFLAFSVIFDI